MGVEPDIQVVGRWVCEYEVEPGGGGAWWRWSLVEVEPGGAW